MDVLALGVSLVALVVALLALRIAAGSRASVGPRPNELTSMSQGGLSAERFVPTESSGQASAPGRPSAQVLALVAAGKKLEAIKQYRIETGAGLKVAKDAVEAVERGRM